MIICKKRSDHVIDFAAEELKKYLRMMMPEKGDIEIRLQPDATDGFRLGLLRILIFLACAKIPIWMTLFILKRMQTAASWQAPIPVVCCLPFTDF